MRNHARILLLLLLCAGSLQFFAQSNSSPNQRVALVIGNSNYDAGPLTNPENDARAMASALRRTGFDVLEYTNVPTQADMKRAIREFGKKIQNGGVGLFYYAGHGIQVEGKNFLIPTRAQIFAEEEVEYESVDVGFVLSQMEIARNRMNIIILDACRNDPFARSWRSAASGLAFINAPTGTLIAYSTAPGSVASDGTGSNGLYTQELLKQIDREGMKIEDVFKNVRAEVLKKSSNMQTPWESSSLVGDFYFIKTEQQTTVSTTPLLAETSVSRIPANRESTEMVEWRKSGDNRYYFYRSGANISQSTTGTLVNDDFLVYDETSRRTYLFRDFSSADLNRNYTPAEIYSPSEAFWRGDGDNTYWFYLQGIDLTDETFTSGYGNGYIIYHKTTGQYYLMEAFKSSESGSFYPAPHIFSDNKTLWYADESYYYLIVDGKHIATRTYTAWKGNHLIVHDEEEQSSYLLRNYYNHTDKVLRPAEVLFRPGKLTVSRDENSNYSTFRDGNSYYTETAAAYSDNDLLVYDTSFNQTVLYKNFLTAPVNTHLQGTPVYSRSGAIWRRKDNIFYLYIRGVLQTGDMVSSAYASNNLDLEVTESSTGLVWILKDYAGRNDNLLRAAELKE